MEAIKQTVKVINHQINITLPDDFNADGNLDVALCGNFYGPDREQWRYDAGAGLIMTGDGNGKFLPLTVRESGFFASKDARGLIELPLERANSVLLVVANNKTSAQVFEHGFKQSEAKIFPIDMKQGFSHAIVTLKNGKKRKQELYCGSGYYSQSALFLILPADAKSVQLFKKNVMQREVIF